MTQEASSSKSVSPDPEVIAKKERKRKRKEAREAVVEEVTEEVVEEPATTKDEADDTDADEETSGSDAEDVPVLSHAERRRQKKEAKLAASLQADADAEGAPVKKRKLKDGSAKTVDSSMRQNSVWVGNMSFKTQQEDLRRFFSDVDGITRVNMPTKAPAGPGMKPENRGCVSLSLWYICALLTLYCRFAYVDFATVEAKTAAIALSEKPLLGRKLLIKDGTDVLHLTPISLYSSSRR